MSTPDSTLGGIYSLPNELLYTILDPLPTKSILTVSPTSRRIHALCVRILHNRLTLAASLADHVLYLEAYPPSAKLTASGLYCHPLGTPGLRAALESPDDAGKIGRFGSLYSLFRPQRAEPMKKVAPRHRPGDIPGSRTHPATEAAASNGQSDEAAVDADLVGETVSLDAEELFTQLCVVVNLVKLAPGAIFLNLLEVCDGMVRVWRDWLKAEAGGPAVPLHSQQASEQLDHPTNHQRILWVNKGDRNVGIRCAVKAKNWRRDNPVLLASDEEVAVSYHLEFEELYIRTTHLVYKLEEILEQQDNAPTRAMVFSGTIH